MNRPSHWILVFFAVVGGVLWGTGQLGGFVVAKPAAPGIGKGEPPSVVVRRPAHTAPKPTNSVLVGRVVDRLGWPVVAAEVAVVGDSSTPPVMTDAEGRFAITVTGAVNKRLSVVARGRHDVAIVRGSLDELFVVLQDALPWRAGVEIEPPSPDLDSLLIGEGFLKDENGRHVAGARVTVRETGASVRTDSDGHYTIPLPRGTSTLVAFGDRGRVDVSEPMTHTRAQGRVPLPELRLEPGLVVRGRLIDQDGEPRRGATVVLQNGGIRRQAQTTESGAFVIEGLVAGESELAVLPHRGHLGFRRVVDIASGGASTIDLGDFVFERAAPEPLRLRVVDREHHPMSYVHVVAEQQGLRRAYGQANQYGEVALAGLASGEIGFAVRDTSFDSLEIVAYDTSERELVVLP